MTLDDVDLNEVTRTAKIAVAEGRLSQDVDVNDPKDLLRRFGLLKGDQPLNSALALFSKRLMFYPQCILKMAWFKGKDKTIFLDNRMVEGNIIQLQGEAMAFCFKHLNLSGVVRGLYREEELEVPADALREAIINALAHRLYTSSGSVSLAIYDDRVEISNPGNFNPEVAVQGLKCLRAKCILGSRQSGCLVAMQLSIQLMSASEESIGRGSFAALLFHTSGGRYGDIEHNGQFCNQG